MALTRRLKQGFLRMPLSSKVMLLASGTLALSAVLPWYDNRNNFGVGDAYLGVQGPLFVVGFLVLGLGLISFLNLFLPLLQRQSTVSAKKSSNLALLASLQSLVLILVANSVFFHAEFGTTVTQKGTRFGMIMALVSIVFLGLSAWAARRQPDFELEYQEEAVEEEEVFERTYDEEAAYGQSPGYEAPARQERPAYGGAYSGEAYGGQRRAIRSSYGSAQPSYSQPETVAAEAPAASAGGADPLTLDPKERYKQMRSQMRRSQAAQNNLWGGSANRRLP